jgi:NAD(P)-dependent dehydrogenase (short-subunit alcohol dehydrogenase family)
MSRCRRAIEWASVVVNDRTQAAVDSARASIAGAASRPVEGFAGDLSQAAAAAAVLKAFPDISILVNNLGHR